MNRYHGKPFLRLLDSYVLDAIGQLTDEQRNGLSVVEPKLKALYNSPWSWQEIVRTQMGLPESFSESVRAAWGSYLQVAKNHGRSVHPDEFAKQFVDEYFPETLGE